MNNDVREELCAKACGDIYAVWDVTINLGNVFPLYSYMYINLRVTGVCQHVCVMKHQRSRSIMLHKLSLRKGTSTLEQSRKEPSHRSSETTDPSTCAHASSNTAAKPVRMCVFNIGVFPVTAVAPETCLSHKLEKIPGNVVINHTLHAVSHGLGFPLHLDVVSFDNINGTAKDISKISCMLMSHFQPVSSNEMVLCEWGTSRTIRVRNDREVDLWVLDHNLFFWFFSVLWGQPSISGLPGGSYLSLFRSGSYSCFFHCFESQISVLQQVFQ